MTKQLTDTERKTMAQAAVRISKRTHKALPDADICHRWRAHPHYAQNMAHQAHHFTRASPHRLVPKRCHTSTVSECAPARSVRKARRGYISFTARSTSLPATPHFPHISRTDTPINQLPEASYDEPSKDFSGSSLRFCKIMQLFQSSRCSGDATRG